MAREYTDQAQFNLGLLYLQGTYGILRSISTAFMNSDRHKVILGLRTLYREVACKLKPNERTKIDNLFKSIHPYYNREHELMKKLKANPKDLEIKDELNQINNKIFRKLEDIDVALRDYFEIKGLLIPNKKDFTRFENLE